MANAENTRNQQIMELIEQGHMPVLAFEVDVARLAFRGMIEEQVALGKAMAAAMSQSSETWHDNAPADSVRHDAEILSKRAGQVSSVIHEGVLVDYPDEFDEVATLGSIVRCHFGNDVASPSTLFITGVTRNLPDELQTRLGVEEEPDFTVVSVTAPLGKALLDAIAGDAVNLNLDNGRQISVTVDGIRQFNPEA